MAVEVSTTGFSSNLLVEELSMDTEAILADLPEGETAGAAFVMAGPDSASASYGIEALEQASSNERLRATVYVPIEGSEHLPFVDDGLFPAKHFRAVNDAAEMRRIRRDALYYSPNAEATIALVRFLGEDEDTDAVVPLLPGATEALDEQIRLVMNKIKDVDGVAPNPWFTPTTPEGMVALANHILVNLPDDHPLRIRGITAIEQLSPEEIAVYGFGNVVGKPLVEDVLPSHGVEISPDDPNVFRYRKDIERGLGELALGKFAVAFTGYRAAGTMRRVAPATIVIDVGNAVDENGVAMGNAHPDLVAQSGIDGRIISRFIGGAGRVTIGIVLQRAAANRVDEIRYREWGRRASLHHAVEPPPPLIAKVRAGIAAPLLRLPAKYVEQYS